MGEYFKKSELIGGSLSWNSLSILHTIDETGSTLIYSGLVLTRRESTHGNKMNVKLWGNIHYFHLMDGGLCAACSIPDVTRIGSPNIFVYKT
jgi:hypothetical protein